MVAALRLVGTPRFLVYIYIYTQLAIYEFVCTQGVIRRDWGLSVGWGEVQGLMVKRHLGRLVGIDAGGGVPEYRHFITYAALSYVLINLAILLSHRGL